MIQEALSTAQSAKKEETKKSNGAVFTGVSQKTETEKKRKMKIGRNSQTLTLTLEELAG